MDEKQVLVHKQQLDTNDLLKLVNSISSFPFCKRVSHFEIDLQFLNPKFHNCYDFPVFHLLSMV